MALKIASKQLVLAIAGLTFALSAAAQWQWIGKDGRKVFSDRPPTSDIPQKDIIKRPGGSPAAPAIRAETADAAAPVAVPASAASASKANATKLPGKDDALEAKKKKLQDDEAKKLKADEEKIAEVKADNCERAKRGLLTFQSGARVAITNAKGEREVMDDKARGAEIQRLQGMVDSNCK